MFCILFSTLLFQFDNMKIWTAKITRERERDKCGEEEQWANNNNNNDKRRKPSTRKYIVVVTRLRRLFEHSLDEKMTVIGLFSRNIFCLFYLWSDSLLYFTLSVFLRSANASCKCREKAYNGMHYIYKRTKAEGCCHPIPFHFRIISGKSWFLWINAWRMYYIFVEFTVHQWIEFFQWNCNLNTRINENSSIKDWLFEKNVNSSLWKVITILICNIQSFVFYFLTDSNWSEGKDTIEQSTDSHQMERTARANMWKKDRLNDKHWKWK